MSSDSSACLSFTAIPLRIAVIRWRVRSADPSSGTWGSRLTGSLAANQPLTICQQASGEGLSIFFMTKTKSQRRLLG